MYDCAFSIKKNLDSFKNFHVWIYSQASFYELIFFEDLQRKKSKEIFFSNLEMQRRKVLQRQPRAFKKKQKEIGTGEDEESYGGVKNRE